MAVVFDPHQNESGNLLPDQAVTVIGTKYRMLVPPSGPFYTHSLVVKSGNTVLKLGNDYLITHPYMTATQRTGRSVHGMIWIVNPNYVSNFKVTAHYVGLGAATTAQINAERAANAARYPSDCQWEEVIGDVYFPPVDIQFDWDTWRGERELMQAVVEIGQKIAASSGDQYDETNERMVLAMLRKYYALVDSLYRNSPALPHVNRTDNPHGDQSYGRMRAIELNGIADDATLVYGRNQASLTDYVNQRSATQADFTDKMMRNTATPRTITGTFTMLPGLSSITSAKGNEADGVGTNLQVDDKVVRLLARDSSTINAGNQPITFKAGANQLVLYPDAREIQWNGKKLLDPTTVGPYLPGNEGGGSGVFYATNSLTVTAQGSGIQTMPFIFTWLPPDDTDPAALALRQLTNDFGNSESLAATPALIQKLADNFTGKLEKAKAYINGLSLQSSVTLDKTSFNLDNVVNLPDAQMPVSDAQATEFARYAVTGHRHAASFFGIGDATTAKAGLVKFGGLVDDATLALDGASVLPLISAVDNMEDVVGQSDSEVVLDIIRYGTAGTADIPDGATVTGWMVTLKANNYFIKKDYPVPLATFNVAELFPNSYQDTTLGIFVDLVNGVAQYVLKDTINFAENDTLTRIGEIATDENAILQVTIRNTTRLGDFRELVEHAADANAHTPRTMTQAQYGYTFGKGGAIWNNAPVLNKRYDGDWRMLNRGAYVPMANVDWSGANTLLLRKTALGISNHRHLLHMTPLASIDALTLSATSATTTASSLLDVTLMAYRDRAQVLNRFSLLINRTNNVTSVDGDLCYLGFAVNFGDTRSFVLGIKGSSFATAQTWAQMAPVVSFKALPDANGVPVITGTVSVAGMTFTFSLNLTTAKFVVTQTAGGGTATETFDLTAQLAAAQVDTTPMTSDPEWPFYFGVGGMFDADMTVSFTTTTLNGKQGYETAYDYIHNLSDVMRFRFLSGPSAKASADALRTMAATANLALASNRADHVPDYLNKDRLSTYCDGTTYTAVVVRD